MTRCATADPDAPPADAGRGGGPDALSTALACARWNVGGYRTSTQPAGAAVHHRGERGRFLLVQSGRLELVSPQLEAGAPTVLEAGHHLLLPRGGTYRALVLSEAVLHSGDVDGDSPDAVRFLQAVPSAVLARCLLVHDPFVATALEQMVRESAAGRPGSASVVAALGDVVTTAALRRWAESGCGSAQALRRYLDDGPQQVVVARALAAIHSDPGAVWTVERMAQLAHVSRSAFAERFREVVGDSPVRYVARFRMEEAKRLLRRQQGTVTEVAARLGYTSDAAFGRAFRRHTGEAPGHWRQRWPDPRSVEVPVGVAVAVPAGLAAGAVEGPNRSEARRTVPPTIAATAPTV